MVEIDCTVDGHVHTRLCHHATGEMEEYVLAGIGCGLRKLVFLEHFEVGINYVESTWLTAEDFQYYQAEGERLREKYRDRIEVGLGIEVGFNPDFIEETIAFLASYPWDRIGISHHFFHWNGRHYNMVSRKSGNLTVLEQVGVDRVADRYFSTLKTAVEVLPGTVLCHLDAVLRHHPQMKITRAHEEAMAEILHLARSKNMALEVNTSGYPQRNRPYPDPAQIRVAVELGIPLAAGSDAHRPDQVGRFFDRLPGLLR
jgi:histidinol-phosphatase (PHP family)